MVFYHLAQDEDVALDCAREMVIKAGTEQQARELASCASMDEGADIWTDPKRSNCTLISPYGRPGIILISAAGF